MDSVFFPSPFLLSSYSLMLVSLIYPYFSRSRWRWPTVHHIWKTWINIHSHTCIGGTTTIYLYCESFRTNWDEESTGVHRDYVTFSRSYFFAVHQFSITTKSFAFLFRSLLSLMQLIRVFVHSHALWLYVYIYCFIHIIFSFSSQSNYILNS